MAHSNILDLIFKIKKAEPGSFQKYMKFQQEQKLQELQDKN